MARLLRISALLMVLLVAACNPRENGETGGTMTPDATFQLISSAFQEDGSIPKKYSCKGEDVSPPLSWSGQPEATVSLALTMTDPDAHGFVHWVVWNIPASASSFAEGEVPTSAVEGRNNFRRVGWGGPCPPSGSHHYVFTLYALDSALDLREGATLSDLQEAMSGHILGQASLTGVFP